MTFHDMSLLAPQTPTTSVATEITIGHVQLRDLIICPHVKGVVNYLHERAIYEHDLFRPGSKQVLADLSFGPNTLAALPIPDSPNTLLAAGGQDAELHLSLHSSSYSPTSHRRISRSHWQYNTQLPGSINNSVMLTSLSLTKAHVTSAEPRMAVSNNDCTVKFFDVNIRGSDSERIKEIGSMKIDVPVNHSSVSPDGSTLLCVGDSPDVYLHRLSGSSRLTFDRIAKYSLDPYTPTALPYQYLHSNYGSPTHPASFSTAFSPDGAKFAVASQEGVAVVWDVRSSKPLKVYNTDRSRGRERRPNGEASGFLYEEDLWDWSRGGSKAPGWGIRSIKFSPAGCEGREIMTFTEHTSLLHVIDARTFETEEIIRVPDPLAASVRSNPGHRPTRSDSAILSGNMVPHSRVAELPSGSTTEEEEEDGVLIIPSLGSTMEEEDIRRLLGRHGIRAARRGARHPSRRTTHPEDEDMDMTDVEDRERREEEVETDVDELDAEAQRSTTGSRVGSPNYPTVSTAHTVNSSSGQSSIPHSHPLPVVREYTRHRSLHYVPSSASVVPRPLRQPNPYPRPNRVTPWDQQKEPSTTNEDNLDLAGTCFDPTGSYIYVGSVRGVVEYKVRGAEKRWWNQPQWA